MTSDSPHEVQRVGLLVMQTFNFSQDLLLRVRGRIMAEEAAGGAELPCAANRTMLGCDSQGPAAEILWAEEQNCDGIAPLHEPSAIVAEDGAVGVEEGGLWVDPGDCEGAPAAPAAEGFSASPGAPWVHEVMEPYRRQISRAEAFAEPQVSPHPPGARPPAGRRKRAVGAAGRRDGSGKRVRLEDMHGTR